MDKNIMCMRSAYIHSFELNRLMVVSNRRASENEMERICIWYSHVSVEIAIHKQAIRPRPNRTATAAFTNTHHHTYTQKKNIY